MPGIYTLLIQHYTLRRNSIWEASTVAQEATQPLATPASQVGELAQVPAIPLPNVLLPACLGGQH